MLQKIQGETIQQKCLWSRYFVFVLGKQKLSHLYAVLDPQELDREAVSAYNFIVLAANECGSEGELPPLDNFDDRAKLNVTVTVLDVDDEDPVNWYSYFIYICKTNVYLLWRYSLKSSMLEWK